MVGQGFKNMAETCVAESEARQALRTAEIQLEMLREKRDALTMLAKAQAEVIRTAFENLHKWTGSTGPGCAEWTFAAGVVLAAGKATTLEALERVLAPLKVA